MGYEDEIGRKVIGDTHTHVDFPYTCKRCGKAVQLKDRFRWKHPCISTDTNFFTGNSRSTRKYKYDDENAYMDALIDHYTDAETSSGVWARLKERVARLFRRRT